MCIEVKMRRDNLFWGTALILVGVLLYLQTQGYIGNILPYLWPLALILVGVWMILGVYWRPPLSAQETFLIPLSTARAQGFDSPMVPGRSRSPGAHPPGRHS